ncbi:M48 family metallopeptidase [Yunchengibacter salinarum]|uniref:M48 family metallopeptidase n=1 Tax=Yunchengibacter salinarum TaxID=3133399 RepID=UPI0035B5E659
MTEAAPPPDGVALTLADGRSVTVACRPNPRARRMTLRVRDDGSVRVTLPPGVPEREAVRFVQREEAFVAARLAALDAARIGDGGLCPVRGERLRLTFTDGPPRRVWREGDALMVGGPRDMAPRRLESWLKAEARHDLAPLVQDHAAALGVAAPRLSIGDMRSRWGSCSSRGAVRFSFRLVMAPPGVLAYVAAHEMAHMVEMNHSPAFWAEVARLMPRYPRHKDWLRRHGAALMRVHFA